ncbi:Pol polyprotein, partial [Mucuna pruriens]
MGSLITYLKEDRLPEDPTEAEKMVREASKYALLAQQLYQQGFSFPLLRCVDGDEAAYVIREVHEGISQAGYYWPTLRSNCLDYVRRCDKCQRFAENHKAPPTHLHSVTSPWPFHKWGIDILGLFPIAPGQVKFLIVVVDYFTKWVEAEPVTTISSEWIKHFLWKKIICRFGMPTEIVSDNRTQFASKATTEFYEGLKIKQLFTSAEHPQSNGQVKAANKVILRGLRKRLKEANDRWIEELPQVLWSPRLIPPSTRLLFV